MFGKRESKERKKKMEREVPKAIETEYKGYRFRSRSEARWAIFLDCMGVSWEYEPEGFDLGEGLWYLPDFRVTNVQSYHDFIPELYIEVKGEIKDEYIDKIKRFPKPLYIVGNLPTYNNEDNSLQEMAYKGDCLFYNFKTIDGDNFAAYPGLDKDGRFRLFGDISSDLAERDDKATFDAFNKARRARFEHGESSSVYNPAMHKSKNSYPKEILSQTCQNDAKTDTYNTLLSTEWHKSSEYKIRPMTYKISDYLREKIKVISYQRDWQTSDVVQLLLVCGLSVYQAKNGIIKTREEQRKEDEQRKTIQRKNN